MTGSARRGTFRATVLRPTGSSNPGCAVSGPSCSNTQPRIRRRASTRAVFRRSEVLCVERISALDEVRFPLRKSRFHRRDSSPPGSSVLRSAPGQCRRSPHASWRDQDEKHHVPDKPNCGPDLYGEEVRCRNRSRRSGAGPPRGAAGPVAPPNARPDALLSLHQFPDGPRVTPAFVLCRHPYDELADLSSDGSPRNAASQ